MHSFSLKSILPHGVAVVLFIILTYAYLSPLLEGKTLRQSDVSNYYGMSKEAADYHEKTGEIALWTDAMFGGMPTYLITGVAQSNLIAKIHNILVLNGSRPAGMIFLYLLGFYIALLAFGVSPWLSIAGAVAYGFSSYFFIILEPGHITKAVAIGYMPPIIAGVYLAYNKKILTGGILTGIFLTLQILINHMQITYYTFIIIVVLGLFELGKTILEKKYISFIKATSVLIFAAILAVGSNITNLWLTYEYGKYSMRGESELTSNKENKTSGLDKDYATGWSYGIGETLTLLIPNAKGGSSGGELSTSSETYDYFNKQYGSAQAKQIIKQVPLYWGDQPFTSGPVYAGSAVIFLFVLGMFLLKGHLKWWLLAVTVLSIMLAWGKNFMGFTDFFLDHIPGYNKFRTVSMTLVIAEFALPLLAVLCLDYVFKNKIDKKKFMKALKWSLGLVGGLVLILTVMPGAFFDFSSANDAQYAQGGYPISALQTDRESLFRMDGFRSLVFILLMAGVVYLTWKRKVKTGIAALLVGVIFITDMWTIDKRYLNNDMFITKTEEKNPFKPNSADLEILKDKDPDYRVLNVAVNTFNDASTSYFHKSIGGYHGAKMKRYQELINEHISKNNMQVLNMLNMKYVIVPTKEQGPVAQQNPYALGNAWFVKSYRLVENADSELNALTKFDPSQEAIVDKRYSDILKGITLNYDSTAQIKLTKYSPNALSYESNSNSEQLAVFSEIYYDKGWNAFIDDKPVPHFRANYVLRAMLIPAGKHKIDYKFEPESYKTGETISFISSALLLLLLVGTISVKVIKAVKNKEKPVQNSD